MSDGDDHWQPIETAPRRGHVVLLTAAGSVVRAKWCWLEGCDDDGRGGVSGWGSVTEDEHPNCWTDGFCWEVNSDGEPSDPPVKWCALPTDLAKGVADE